MSAWLQKPWVVAAIVVIILATATIGEARVLVFKPDVLTKEIPSLLAGLIAIAAITERATAVINDIWFGPSRIEAEDDVRLVNRKVNDAETRVQKVQETIAAEAARSGDSSLFTANASVLSAVPVAQLAGEIKSSDKKLAEVRAKETYARLSLAFVIAVIISAVGVRTLASLFQLDNLSRDQGGVFHTVDIVLTAGVLTGGTAGISAISELLGTYVNISRKRALEKS